MFNGSKLVSSLGFKSSSGVVGVLVMGGVAAARLGEDKTA